MLLQYLYPPKYFEIQTLHEQTHGFILKFVNSNSSVIFSYYSVHNDLDNDDNYRDFLLTTSIARQFLSNKTETPISAV